MVRLFLFFFLSLMISNLSAQQVNINPSIVNFHLQSPGTSENKVIIITNNSANLQSFEISIGDWNRTENGTHDYFQMNTQPYSCASWLTFDKSFIEIPAGQSAEIVLTINASNNEKDFEAMKWAMLFIQGANLKPPVTNGAKEAKASIQEIVRMGIHIYQSPLTLTENAASAKSLNVSTENPNVYDFSFENTGKTMLTCKSHLEVISLADSKETITEIIEAPVFPGGKRTVQLELPANLPKGKYSILAVLDYSEYAPLEAVEKVIEIK